MSKDFSNGELLLKDRFGDTAYFFATASTIELNTEQKDLSGKSEDQYVEIQLTYPMAEELRDYLNHILPAKEESVDQQIVRIVEEKVAIALKKYEDLFERIDTFIEGFRALSR